MAMQFTRNYDLLNLYASGAYYWDETKSVANNWRLRNTNGTYQTGYPFYYSDGHAPFSNLLKNHGFYNSTSNLPYIEVGTSGTVFSYEDYKLTTFTKTEYSDKSTTYSVSDDNSSITVTMYQTFLNSSGSEQTVREVGLIDAIYNSNGYDNYLIAREVLETPIVVPANGYFKVPVTFTVAVPTDLIPH